LIKKAYFLRKSDIFHVEKILNKEYVFARLLKQLTITDVGIVKNLMAFVSAFNGFSFLYFPKDKDKILKSFKEEIYG